MTRPIYGSAMLQTAQRLAGVGAGRGRPPSTDLRRATSTAYYALFHQVVRHGSFEFLPAASEDDAAEVARWFTHTGIRQAAHLVTVAAGARPADQVRKADQPGVIVLRAAAGSSAFPLSVLTVAEAFISLREARHSADYDGRYDPVKATTLNHLDDAAAALREAQALWRGGEDGKMQYPSAPATYRVFLRLALLHSGGPKAR